MLKTYKLVFLLGASAAVSTNCGKEAKKKVDRAGDVVELQGSWTSACNAKKFLLSTTNRREQFDFSLDRSFKKEIIDHQDSGCKNEEFRTTIAGQFEVIGPATETPEAKNINFTVKTVTVKSYNDTITKSLNTPPSYCGITDWRTGEERNVTGRTCGAKTLKEGDVLYDIYRVRDNHLSFGDAFLGLDEQVKLLTRPTKFNDEKTFTKR